MNGLRGWLQLAIAAVVVLGSAIMVISRVEGTTRVLGEKVEMQADSTNRLATSVDKLKDSVSSLDRRISFMEGKSAR